MHLVVHSSPSSNDGRVSIARLRVSGKEEESVRELDRAAAFLARAETSSWWIPCYAKGRLCMDAHDFVEALNVDWDAKIAVPPRPKKD